MVDQENFRLIQALDIRVVKHILRFKKPAKTSRNVLTERDVYYITLHDQSNRRYGIGECAPIWGLSPETKIETELVLKKIQDKSLSFEEYETILRQYSSVRFAMETAWADIASGGSLTPFSSLESIAIAINGLVWMGDDASMLQEAYTKIEQGFTCIKLKVGGLNFEQELNILSSIRSRYNEHEVTIRLDANGAFDPNDAITKLQTLAQYHIHSLEQPIKAGQTSAMAQICRQSPIPIALDEELIGVHNPEAKKQLLHSVMPQFIILKPTLHGGISGCNEWIELAESMNIGWWATSALESNIGLNAIARWVSTKQNPLEQGLGTGALYEQNIHAPLAIRNGQLITDPLLRWNLNVLDLLPTLN